MRLEEPQGQSLGGVKRSSVGVRMDFSEALGDADGRCSGRGKFSELSMETI